MDVLINKLLSDELFFFETLIFMVFFVLLIINIVQIRRLRRSLSKVTHNQDGDTIEGIIHQYYDDIQQAKDIMEELRKRQDEMSETLQHCITRIGIVRFNPFGEVGGNQSFAIALLDREDTGIVISSLYGRESSRFYGKPIVKGKSTYVLSKEEEEAVRRAQKGLINDDLEEALPLKK